jgi:hypothetical protein
VDLFPERADSRSSRRLIPAALLASLIVHLALAGVWGYFTYRVVPAIARILPRPTPTPEIVALSDAITIEKRTVPREAHRAPRTRPVRQQPRRVAEAPVQRTLPDLSVPTLPPIPTAAPTARPTTEPTTEPTYRPERGTIHHARAVPTEEPRPRDVPTAAPKNGFSQQQIAALDAQFSRTIAQAQHALTDVPPQRRPPARAPDQIRYEAIMAGTPEQFLSAQGDCTSIIQEGHTATISYYYFRCTIRYSDGYFEDVSFLWPHVFPRGRDPVDLYRRGEVRMVFPMQGPPPGFVLPPHFALSRAVCSFYKARCQSIIDGERANGNQPATDSQ